MSTPARNAPAVRSDADLAELEALTPTQTSALRESGHLDGYLGALRRLTITMGLAVTPVQVRAACLRLHANGHTPDEVEWAVDRLCDSREFSDRVHRFRCPLVPADVLGVLRDRPKPTSRYTRAEADQLADRLGLPPERFVAVEPDGTHRPFAFIAPTTPTPDA